VKGELFAVVQVEKKEMQRINSIQQPDPEEMKGNKLEAGVGSLGGAWGPKDAVYNYFVV